MTQIETYHQQFLEKLTRQDFDGAQALIDSALAENLPPKQILVKVISASLDQIGVQQANHEITLSEVFVMAKICDSAIERLNRAMRESPEPVGTVVVGTAAGDFHSLGRKILASFLRAGGFRVIDLGANVAPARFVETAFAEGAGVICVSALLLHTARGIREVRDLLDARHLQDQIKLVVGGAVFNLDSQLHLAVGANGTARNAPAGVAVVRLLMERKPQA